MLRHSVLTVSLILICLSVTFAQKSAIEEYRVRVITTEGTRVRGILDEVTNEHLYVDYLNSRPLHRSAKIPLALIRKVVIRYNRRKNTLEGAIIGGGLMGFLTIRSSKKNGFRSPIVYGLNLVIAVGAGVGLGALIGSHVGPISRRTIRPFGQTPGEAAETLRRQLQPFTYGYQDDVLNRVPQ